MFEVIEKVLNSPVVVTFLVATLVALFKKWVDMRPNVDKYRGMMISFVKNAEKMVPEDTENRGLVKLNIVLTTLGEVFEKIEGKKLTEKELAEFENEISLIHNELEKERLI